jgi:predicted dienelactone hydrolase
MKLTASALLFGTAGLTFLTACASEIDVFEVGSNSATSSGTGGETASSTAVGTGSTSGAGGDASGSGTGGGAASSGAGGMPVAVADPNQAGPFTTAKLDESFTVKATGHSVKMHAVYPASGPEMGPFPVVIVGHGFQTPITQYESYLERLATFGYVAITVDFPAPFIGNKHIENGQDLDAGLDWAATNATLKPIANVNNAGATGHSLGGKVAVLAAAADPRIKASITLDPVDSSFFCSASDCPDASEKLPLKIPMGFIGETLDASGGFQPCAPAADNFQTFYAKSAAPSLSVEVLGANHLSFTDDPFSGICKNPTAKHEDVLGLSHAMVVAFYERHLKGKAGYDAYLTGSEAKARYIDTGLAKIESK